MKDFTDSEIRYWGFNVLSQVLGDVNAERFITLMIREPKDYTAWRERNMYVGESVHDVAERARTAARRHDDMHGDYSRLASGQIDSGENAAEINARIERFTAKRPAVLA